MISAIIFNIAQSDSYTFMVHSNAYSALYCILFQALSIIINNGSHPLVFHEAWKSTRIAALKYQEKCNICGVGSMCCGSHVASHSPLFPVILSATFFSMTVFAALKRTSFYDRLELWFD